MIEFPGQNIIDYDVVCIDGNLGKKTAREVSEGVESFVIASDSDKLGVSSSDDLFKTVLYLNGIYGCPDGG